MNKKIKFLARVLMILVTAICISGLYFYYIVPNPIKTIEMFQDATNAIDINEMIECFEPKVQKRSKALINVSSSILGGLTGFSIDFSDLVAILPLFAEMDDTEMPNIKIEINDICYSGGIYEKIFSNNGIDNDVLGTIFAEEASCYVAIYNNNILLTEDIFPMKKFGREGWKITAESFY